MDQTRKLMFLATALVTAFAAAGAEWKMLEPAAAPPACADRGAAFRAAVEKLAAAVR